MSRIIAFYPLEALVVANPSIVETYDFLSLIGDSEILFWSHCSLLII